MRDYGYAKIAYDAYCKQTGGVSLIGGDKLPSFVDLKPEIQDAWWAAAYALGHPFRDRSAEFDEFPG
jgi:hypothetical protein